MRQGWLSLVRGWTRRGCGVQWCSAGVLCLPSISPPGWGCLRLGKSLGKVTPSSRASRGCCELCRERLWLQQESSAAGLREFVSEREKQGLPHPYLTFVQKGFNSSSCKALLLCVLGGKGDLRPSQCILLTKPCSSSLPKELLPVARADHFPLFPLLWRCSTPAFP